MRHDTDLYGPTSCMDSFEARSGLTVDALKELLGDRNMVLKNRKFSVFLDGKYLDNVVGVRKIRAVVRSWTKSFY